MSVLKKLPLLINRRNLIKFATASWILGPRALAATPGSGQSHAFETSTAFYQNLHQVLMEFFETDQSAEDASLIIDSPVEAENPELVPFKVIAPGAEKVAVFLYPANNPLISATTVSPGLADTLTFTADLSEGTTIVCYALRNQQVFRRSKTIRIGASGYDYS